MQDPPTGILETLFAASGSSLGGALVILALTWIATAVFRFVGWCLVHGGRLLDRRRRLREMLVDVLIDADFNHQRITAITAHERIAAIKAQI